MDQIRHQLRSRLAPMHGVLDRAVSARCLDRGLDLAALLRIHAAALPGVVAALDRAGTAALYPGWDGDARLRALEADLACLGLATPRGVAPPPRLAGPNAIAGALYALEGSSLGNQMILRRVLAEGGPRERQATTYLRHGGWPRFVAWLAGRDGLDLDAAEAGAAAVFAAYMTAADAQPVGAEA